MLRLLAEFQCYTMPGTGKKVCGVGGGVVWWWWLKPILVFSLAKAEQFDYKFKARTKLE